MTTPDDFREALTRLLAEAHENNIDIEGGWTCRHPDGNPSWDATVVELAERD